MAHPIRPASYMEINNFYTMTVYEKGAEVVRMYQTLLGRDGFRKGMDLYFKRHDGQAVTTEDFLAAMADANQVDLSQFQRWYDQAGTPVVEASMRYDGDEQTCTLSFKQSCPATPESAEKQPYLIPIAVGLLDKNGKDLVGNQVLRLTEREQSFSFTGIASKPVPSLLRGFSAPVRLQYPYSENDLIFLMKYDSDSFNRWDAGQRLAMQTLLQLLSDQQQGRGIGLEHEFISAFQTVLNDSSLDYALRAETLSLPSEADIAELAQPANPEAIHQAREFMYSTLAKALRFDLERFYSTLQEDGAYRVDSKSIGQRGLKNICLDYLGRINDESIQQQCLLQYRQANNMTDALAALAVLNQIDCPQRQQALDEFEQRWQQDPLVMDKWFALQASSALPNTLERVKALTQHKLFDIRNPNKVRALIGSFAMRNPLHFHAEDGSGYDFLTEHVLQLDAINPQIASRMVRPLMNWRQYEAQRSQLMREHLEQIKAHQGLSPDVYEIVTKSLV